MSDEKAPFYGSPQDYSATWTYHNAANTVAINTYPENYAISTGPSSIAAAPNHSLPRYETRRDRWAKYSSDDLDELINDMTSELNRREKEGK